MERHCLRKKYRYPRDLNLGPQNKTFWQTTLPNQISLAGLGAICTFIRDLRVMGSYLANKLQVETSLFEPRVLDKSH